MAESGAPFDWDEIAECIANAPEREGEQSEPTEEPTVCEFCDKRSKWTWWDYGYQLSTFHINQWNGQPLKFCLGCAHNSPGTGYMISTDFLLILAKSGYRTGNDTFIITGY